MDVLPSVDSVSQLVFYDVISDLQGIKAALANRERIVEDLKTEVINGLNPELLTSRVVDQVLNKIRACQPDAVWCLVPSRSTTLQICEENMLIGFWDTLFIGTRLGLCASKEFPISGLMMRKNPDDLVYHFCPGCACEISSFVCHACEYAEKNVFYAKGFCKYSPNSFLACDDFRSQDPIDNSVVEPFSFHDYEDEDYMREYDSSDDVWS